MSVSSQWRLAAIIVPVGISTEANNIGMIYDFDQGGSNSFGKCALSTDGAEPASHYLARVPVESGHVGMTSDPQLFFDTLSQIATERGRTQPVRTETDAFCAQALIDYIDPHTHVTNQGLKIIYAPQQ